jgi:hypothetical protein
MLHGTSVSQHLPNNVHNTICITDNGSIVRIITYLYIILCVPLDIIKGGTQTEGV